MFLCNKIPVSYLCACTQAPQTHRGVFHFYHFRFAAGSENHIVAYSKDSGDFLPTWRAWNVNTQYLLTYLLVYLLTYLLTYSLTHSLHAAQSFLIS